MSQVNVDTINEYNSAAGVTIDGLLIKDGAIPSIAGGLEEVDVWHLTSDFTGDASPIASNLSRWATTWEKIGTGMTESSGIFSFPSTGKWIVEFVTKYTNNPANAAERNVLNFIEVTTNNSSYSVYAQNSAQMYDTATSIDSGAFTAVPLDVTDVANIKVRFSVEEQSGSTKTQGSSSLLNTFMRFSKVGAT